MLDLDEEDEDVQEEIDVTTPTDKHSFFERSGCKSHLLQCCIKDAIVQSPHVNKLIRKLNSIVTFFTRSPLNYEKLKKKTGNLALVRPCATRWNSQFYSLDRIFDEKRENVKKSTYLTI